jgi:hypothetical protein
VAITSSNIFANLSFVDTSLFYFNLINAGGWSGTLNDWLFPGSSLTLDAGSYNFVSIGATSTNDQPLPQSNNSTAEIYNEVKVVANTGSNISNDLYSSMNTGTATALINILNFINFSAVKTNIFMSLANIMGSWTGNIIFAYPDVTVAMNNAQHDLQPGESTHYTIDYSNSGFDRASEVRIAMTVPDHFTYESDTSGITPNFDNNQLTWTINSLEPHEKHSFSVYLKVDESFDFSDHQANRLTFIEQAHATDSTINKAVQITTNIHTPDPETNTINNSAAVTTIIYENTIIDNNPTESTAQVDNRLPILELTSSNNVNRYINQGDTVSFEIQLKNISEIPSYDTIVTNELYNAKHQLVGTMIFPIGVVIGGKSGTLRFGLVIPKNGSIPSGEYYTVSEASGLSPNETEVFSNQSETSFSVKGILFATALAPNPIVSATEGIQPEGQILGTTTKTEDITPYVILTFLSSLWAVGKQNIRRIKYQLPQDSRSFIHSIPSSLAYLFVVAVFTASVLKISTYYDIFSPIETIASAYQTISSLPPPF